jgi:hypothetical protein
MTSSRLPLEKRELIRSFRYGFKTEGRERYRSSCPSDFQVSGVSDRGGVKFTIEFRRRTA